MEKNDKAAAGAGSVSEQSVKKALRTQKRGRGSDGVQGTGYDRV